MRCTTAMWAGSVVRMMWSGRTFRMGQVSRKRAEISSTYSRGVLPALPAASAIFSPCSSVPVWKRVASPVSLRKRL